MYNPKKMEPSETFFIARRAAQRRPIFLWDPNPGTLLEVLLYYREQGKYLLHEFAVLPDQLQAIITPLEGASAQGALKLICGEFASRIAKRAKASIWEAGSIVQRITTFAEYEKFRRTIRLGPVRAGLAAKPTLYAFCSASPEFQIDSSPQS